MATITYKFDVKEMYAKSGYTVVEIRDGVAQVDEDDTQARELAERVGGVKVTPRPTRRQKAGKK